MMNARDPLQEALGAKRAHSFYSIPATHSNFFKTQKYDFEHFGMSFSQRIIAFCVCLVTGMLLFLYSLIRLPGSILSPAAFAAPYALSNLMFFCMFGFLLGFKSYFSNLFSKSKRIYTSVFICSTLSTLYFALFIGKGFINYILMFLQIVSFVCFAVTFLPGGAGGISSLISMVFKK
jgi:hypothetical protein